jgi:superfamily II DNA or RNA helicase
MLKFKVFKTRNCIKLVEWDSDSEKGRLRDHFTKKSKDGDFNVLVDRGIWDGMDNFMSKENEIPIGLWKEIYSFSEKNQIKCEISGLKETLNLEYQKENYTEFVKRLFNGVVDEHNNTIYPRDYQFEAAYKALQYKYCTQELATSAGKTLIFYIFNSYLKHTGIISRHNKALMIVPNISLVGQTEEKFKMYSNGLVNWNILMIGGRNKFSEEEFREADLVISTYQSLISFEEKSLDSQLTSAVKKKMKLERLKKPKEKELEKAINKVSNLKEKIDYAKLFRMFESYSVVNVDETHKSRGSSISNIISACNNWRYKLGLSGTAKVSEEYSDFYKIQEKVGPLVMTLSAKHLIDHGYSPNVSIRMVYLTYNKSNTAAQEYIKMRKSPDEIKRMYRDNKEYGREMLTIEKGIIFESQERLDLISGMIRKFGKNTLILFSDIKNEYGKNICKKLQEWNKDTYYIDGGVESEQRDEYKDAMEKNEGVIIVASFGTFATGIDLKNVHHIVFSETTKAEITIRQAIGRGMRKLANKNKVTIWDLVDKLDGYSVRHSEVREKIYTEQSFPIKKHQVSL